ncbi:HAD family hydrolase [Desulfomonile tiedjei]|uniref:Haloacid dehalogenase superfamily protein, subfamily IA, variant 3 with third motif having DD or ED n=1 Tax=Desulfomonile tiedjei (strain ATCC 49306 / DSM 6799 / DCB-1) TaxID=706587 RepID=I4C2V5_DESTA|nr:HAD family phosphatase [Desulfomonile tiedjei]AFM23896.1 haloacid dehalogenase superfamily protein, subfamily IA, variant 3 with third motif having DD or ED [Desulfomonile tiedjei DSM 6799]
MKKQNLYEIAYVVLDFGGVIAEEGFKDGLYAIAKQAGLPPEDFFGLAARLIYDCGYVKGKFAEHDYWALLREKTGIQGTDEALRREILERFILRSWVLDAVRKLRKSGLTVAVLSDQTQWLDELDAQHRFFREFDVVFNSYHLGMTKKDPAIFDFVASHFSAEPSKFLFVDDNPGNVQMAISRGFNAFVFTDKKGFINSLGEFGLTLD